MFGKILLRGALVIGGVLLVAKLSDKRLDTMMSGINKEALMDDNIVDKEKLSLKFNK